MKDPVAKLLGALGVAVGALAAWFYWRQGLTLSHYDAKAHLVVARRILDSLTPNYDQIGAVWLPLPHLLNALPVQVDAFYRTGASAVAMSILAFGIACYAIARLVLRLTGSRLGAFAAVSLFALEPDVLYLQSTPMTEPLLFALTLLSVSLVYDWVAADAAQPPRAAGWALVGACLTRYEAWCVTGALIVLAFVALVRRGLPPGKAARETATLASYPLLAIVAFMCHSRYTIGAWFVTGGFFESDPATLGNLSSAFLLVVHGIRRLTSDAFLALALVGLGLVLVRAWRSRAQAPGLVALALMGFLALPTYAFYEGHPFRSRYMIAAVVGIAVFCGIAIGLLRGWLRAAAFAMVVVTAFMTVRPLDANAPMVQEAQWDRPNSVKRRAITACLMQGYRHEPILVSMGSLAHYMQELSAEGLNIRDFMHEGNHPQWDEALVSPKGRVGWILVEERSEGGDVIARRARESSTFFDGFTRVCESNGVALYRAEN